MDFDKKNFSEWYTEVLKECDIVDLRYPVKGMPVYRGWGFSIMRKIFYILENMLNDSDHQQMLFPLFVPDDQFGKEADHIKGFEGQVLWTTHAGLDRLERKLAVRPTSETVMYPMFSLWIQNHADLPFRVHQTVCIYRHETKATRPLIRGREVYWNEAHTAHASKEDCEKQVKEALGIYSSFFKKLGLPFLMLKRPDYDKFAGSEYSIAFDCPMPDGRVLQIGTVHNLGQNFAKVYEVKYAKENGEQEYCFQTCYGISMRALAAVISVHGDKKGLVLPPSISPIDAVVIPILFGEGKEILEKAKELKERMAKIGLKTVIDDSNKRPGDKYYFWEARGVPLRIEVGPKDLQSKSVVLAGRLGEKKKVMDEELEEEIMEEREVIGKKLLSISEENLEKSIGEARSIKDLEKEGNEKTFVKIFWCEDVKCAEEIEKTGVEMRGIPAWKEPEEGKCIACGKKGKEAYCAKAY